jgi:hypothetical protein
MEDKNKKDKLEFNPIDKDKIAENPHLLPYAHTVGGAVIKPIDKGRTKGLAVEAMREQTNMQLEQLRQQIELLAAQAQAIQKRVQISEMIYQADMNFKPLINHIYHLYQRADETPVLSMIGPEEWGRKGCPFARFLATARLLADHTWQILADNTEGA